MSQLSQTSVTSEGIISIGNLPMLSPNLRVIPDNEKDERNGIRKYVDDSHKSNEFLQTHVSSESTLPIENFPIPSIRPKKIPNSEDEERNGIRKHVDDFLESDEFLKSLPERFFLSDGVKESLYRSVEKPIRIGRMHLAGFGESEKVKIVTSPYEMLDYFKLRFDGYTRVDYIKNFPSRIPNMEFDDFDEHSLVLARKEEDKSIGYVRIVLDSHLGIMSERFCKYKQRIRIRRNPNIGEMSRLVIDKSRTKSKRTSLDLYEKFPEACKCLGIESLIGAMQTSERPRYDEFGCMEILEESFKYGNIDGDSSLINWKVNK